MVHEVRKLVTAALRTRLNPSLFLNPLHNKEHLLLLEIVFVFFRCRVFILSNGNIFPVVHLDENYPSF